MLVTIDPLLPGCAGGVRAGWSCVELAFVYDCVYLFAELL